MSRPVLQRCLVLKSEPVDDEWIVAGRILFEPVADGAAVAVRACFDFAGLGRVVGVLPVAVGTLQIEAGFVSELGEGDGRGDQQGAGIGMPGRGCSAVFETGELACLAAATIEGKQPDLRRLLAVGCGIGA